MNRWILLAVLIVVATQAEAPDKYGLMARTTYSAFKCMAWAERMRDAEEQERLFLLGLESGREFITALKDDPSLWEGYESEAPMIVTMLLQGPSTDFILGRIFESALEDALEGVFGDGDTYHDEEMQELIAHSRYADANCSILGR